jgi:hypothetical protein
MHEWTPIWRLAATGILVALLGILPACKQGEGDRCQINDDCGDGLYCELGGNTKTIGGVCKSLTSPAPVIDMTQPPADMAGRD